jgi:hypothetical protein
MGAIAVIWSRNLRYNLALSGCLTRKHHVA